MSTFRKIGFDGETVTIITEDKTEEATTTSEVKSKDQPSQAFRDALQALAKHVIEICECPPDWLNSLTIRGVSLSYSEAGVMTVVITALRKLTWSVAPMVMNTPAKPDDGDSENCISRECATAIDLLTIAAQAYLDGERWAVQEELPDGEPDNVTVSLTGPDGEVLLPKMSTKKFKEIAQRAGRKHG